MTLAAKLKSKLANNEILVGCLCAYNSPWLIEVLALCGYDYVLLDLEHEPFNDESVANLIRVADGYGLPTILRLPLSDRIQPLLNAGASGIHVPDIRGRAHAEEVVDMTRLPPRGQRAYYTQTRLARYGLGIDEAAEVARMQEDLLVIGMIESIELVEQLDSVLDVDGIDAFHIGPLDLAKSMGAPTPAEVEQVIADVARRCRAANKYLAIGVVVPWGLDNMELRIQQGAQLFSVASAWMLTDAIGRFFNEVNGRIPKGRRSGPLAPPVARNPLLSNR
jgi:4-hydroxy-2-oxoheptanedioate aldolase